MYSKDLEAIIEAALADGTLTEKERAVLHKRAAAEGVDPDELDVVIDGRLAKIKKEEDWLRPTPPVQKETEKLGNIVKCPNCGAHVLPGQGKCNECGHVFVNVATNKSSEKLANILRKIDGEDRMASSISEIFLGNGKKKAKEKANIINTFPIPNSKSDLLDFMTMLLPLSAGRREMPGPRSENEDFILGTAYYNKLKECVNRVKVTFPNDSDFNYLLKEYEKESKKWTYTKKILIIIVPIWILILLLFWVLPFLLG